MKREPEEIKESSPKKDKKPREKKADKYEGSRWASVILLILTVLAALFFSIRR